MDWRSELDKLVEQGKLQDIAPLLDEAELESEELDPLVEWPHTIHILGHVLNADLVSARFLWKRLPDVAKEDAETRAAWRIVQALWNYQFEEYKTLLQGADWSERSQPLIASIAEKLHREVLDLIEQVYTDIPVERMATLLGVEQHVAIQNAEERGWRVTGGSIEVVKKPRPFKGIVVESQLQKLAEIITHLES